MASKYNDIIAKGNSLIKLADTDIDQAIREFLNWKATVKNQVVCEGEQVRTQIYSSLMFKENPFSKIETIKALIDAVEATNRVLTDVPETGHFDLDEGAAVVVVQRILRNFHKHIEEMYQNPVHGKGTINQDALKKIVIGNEYDVQRILFSLIRPVFPQARVEVCGDGGYSGTRFDILIDQYSIVIEVKCTRSSMSEKKLTEEIGADIYHYDRKHIMFFIFDKEKLISNVDAFERAYTKRVNEKSVESYVIQPIYI